MDVRFIETSSAKLSEVPITNGQVVALNDEPGLFYDLNGNRYSVAPKAISHVGMVVHSTTLDTMAKVIEMYGGTTWVKIEGQFLLGQSSSHAVNSTGGSETNTIAVANLPGHTHSVGAHSHGLNSHTHSVPAHAHGLNSHTHSIPGLSGTAVSAGAHTHQVNLYTGETNKGAARCVQVQAGTGETAVGVNTYADWNVRAISSGAHTHTVSTYAGTTGGNSGNTAKSSALTSGAASGSTANSSAFNSGSTGSGTAINNMPPFKTVYIWERIA